MNDFKKAYEKINIVVRLTHRSSPGSAQFHPYSSNNEHVPRQGANLKILVQTGMTNNSWRRDRE